MVGQGGLTKALEALHPKHKRKSWRVLCDSERFLTTDECKAAHKKAKVRLWQIPAKSPDFNPVEKFWAWLRKKLGKMDLDDLVNDRPVPGATAYKERVRRVLKSPKAQQVAKNIFRGFRKTALDIQKRRGQAAARG